MNRFSSLLAQAEAGPAAEGGFFDTYGPMIIDYGTKIVGVIVVFIIGRMVANGVAKAIQRRLEKREFDPTLTRFFASLARTLILVGVVLACLGMFGVDTTSFAAVLAAMGFAVGMALQGSLANFAAGIMLLVFRPYKVGDIISAAGVTGGVIELNLFTTVLDTPDNRRFVAPNGAIFAGNIENLTFHGRRRVDVNVGADYGADIDATRKVLESAIPNIPSRIVDDAHQVFLSELGGSSVDWQVRVWCEPANYWAVYQETIRAIKMAMDAAGIGIPFPQMDVHLDGGLDKK
jgi:small conductance mechanosensitive channel